MTNDITIGVVEAIADAEGVDPTELDLTIGEYVDLDALSQFVDHDGTEWTVTFHLPTYEVTVTDGGTVLVDDAAEHDSIRA